MKSLLQNSRPLRLIVVGVALAATAVSRAQSAAQSTPAATSETVELQGYTYEQRSDFTVAIRSAAAQLDAKIVPLTKRQKGGLAGGDDAMTMERVQSSRNELSHQIAKLEDVSEDNWTEVRDGVVTALAQTQEAYAEADKTSKE